MDIALQACLDELEKIAAIKLPTGSTFGKNVGKNYGWGSNKGGWSTQFRSAGMGSAKPAKAPQLPGTKKIKGVGGLKPPQVAEANNQVELRRGLSNIETRQ